MGPFQTFRSGIRPSLGIICGITWDQLQFGAHLRACAEPTENPLEQGQNLHNKLNPVINARSTLVGGKISHHNAHHLCSPKQRCILGLQ